MLQSASMVYRLGQAFVVICSVLLKLLLLLLVVVLLCCCDDYVDVFQAHRNF